MKKNFSHLTPIFKLAIPYWPTLLCALLALLIASAINLTIPELIRRILNSDSVSNVLSSPFFVASTLTAVFAVQAIAFYFRSYWFGKVGHSVVYDLRSKLFTALLTKPIDFFDQEKTGDLLSRLNADALMLQDVVSIRLSVCIRYAIQIVLGIILMIAISFKLTLAIIIVIPALVLLAKYLGTKLKALTKEQQSALASASSFAEQAISGIRTVKAFNGEALENTKFLNAISTVREIGVSRSRFSAFFSSSVNFLMHIALVFVVLFGLTQVTNNTLSSGDLTAFLMYGLIVGISFAFLAGSISEIYQGAGAAERIFEITAHLNEESSETTHLTEPIETITFSSVSFSYPTRKEIQAINDISFALKKGAFTALVGPSGAGKTSIVNLLLRFYEPITGSIAVNNTEYREFSRASLRAQIALVSQDPTLFADTIANNLKYAKQDATPTELNDVLQRASLLEFTNSLPKGIDTYVGERGVQLSGGQKQRLAIARALLRKPSLLILDEATSSLDSENEALIQKAISSIKDECAILSIAHRLATIQEADNILVLHKGSIIQQGTHIELIQDEGVYRDFVQYQKLITQ